MRPRAVVSSAVSVVVSTVAVVVGLVAVSASCATTRSANDAVAPCARARLAREWPPIGKDGPPFEGCWRVVDGPEELKAAGLVVLTDLAEEILEDEPPRFRLATTEPFLASTSTTWELLSSSTVRLAWLQGIRGVELCLTADNDGAKPELDGDVVIVGDRPPFATAVGRVTLRRATCPG